MVSEHKVTRVSKCIVLKVLMRLNVKNQRLKCVFFPIKHGLNAVKTFDASFILLILIEFLFKKIFPLLCLPRLITLNP
jgi:hypothetical protein